MQNNDLGIFLACNELNVEELEDLININPQYSEICGDIYLEKVEREIKLDRMRRQSSPFLSNGKEIIVTKTARSPRRFLAKPVLRSPHKTTIITTRANGYNGQSETETEAAYEGQYTEEAFRQAILDGETMLNPGMSLNLSRARPGKGRIYGGMIGARLIKTPESWSRTHLVQIPGHSRLLTSPERLEEYTNLLGGKTTRANGCGR